MIIDVLIWDITANYTGSWDVEGGGSATINSGQTIVVKLDDTTGSLTAWQNGTNKLLNGPNLFFGYDGAATLRTVAPFYQYCEGTTLRQVGTSNGFPYGTLGSNHNNSECQIAPTCDLEISNIYTITPTTGPSSADGSIVGSATTSNGIPKFSFDPAFDYGLPYERFPLPALEDWVVYDNSSEPMSWTTGIANPVLTLDGPTIQPNPTSDALSVVMAFEEGELYKFQTSFSLFSDHLPDVWPSGRYVSVKAQILTAFDIVLASRSWAGFASVTGRTIGTTETPWQFIMPAGAHRLVVFVEYQTDTTPNNDYVVINHFRDLSGTEDDPGVFRELNFSGLLSGTYTVYAKDSAGCQDSLTFEIPITEDYGVRYRMEYTDVVHESRQPVRIDIEQRNYTGEIEEICGGQQPARVRYEGDRDDPNVALVPSNLTLEMVVNTSEEFLDFYLCDERKYRVKMYIGDPLELYWVGYHVPEFGSEPYLAPPYYFQITASDWLGEMKNLDFVDVSENNFKGDMSAIKILSEVLKKTGLELDIRSGINVFDSGMSTDPEDDPLEQAYIDTRIYYNNKKVPDKCDKVLRSIADPFRGQIFQSMGKWWIIRLSDAIGTFAYREFDFEGVYSANSTFDAVKELDFPSAVHAGGKLMFANKTQLLSVVRNYGYFAITHDLKKDGNLIDTGLFESEDIIELASGNKTFKDWNVLVGQPGVKYGHETVVNGDSTGAFYFDFNSAVGNQIDTQLYSTQILLDSRDGRIRFKFQYFVTPIYTVPYIRIAWTLKFHSASNDTFTWLTYATNGAITYDFVEQKNEIYVSSYDSWQTFDLLTSIPPTDADYFEISFFFHDHHGRDFDSIVDLKAFDPSTLSNPRGTKRMVAEDFGETRIYIAEYSLDAESLPDVVRPDSYDVGSGEHRWLWRLDKIVPLGQSTGLVNRIKFDNVSVAFYPLVLSPTTQYIDPPETLTYSEEVDEFVKSDFTKDVLLGDMIRFHESSTRNEKNLYRSYFRLADGTPTLNWHRSGVDESKRILQILLEDYIAQFSLPARKLSGAKIPDTAILHFVNCLRDNVDGARYRPMTFEFDVKNAMYTPDMAAVVAGEDGEPPYAPGSFDSEEFSSAFSIGN